MSTHLFDKGQLLVDFPVCSCLVLHHQQLWTKTKASHQQHKYIYTFQYKYDTGWVIADGHDDACALLKAVHPFHRAKHFPLTRVQWFHIAT